MPDPVPPAATPPAADGTVTISATDHAALLRSYQLLNKLWDDPTHGTQLKRAVKAVDPTIRVPELDVLEPALAPLREQNELLTKTLDDLKAEQAKDREERAEEKQLHALTTGIEAAQKKYRLTPDGRNEMIEILKRGEANTPESAAALIVANLEPSAPVNGGSNYGPTAANVFGIDGAAEDADTKLLHNDPMRWLDNAVPRIMAEVEAGQEAA